MKLMKNYGCNFFRDAEMNYMSENKIVRGGF